MPATSRAFRRRARLFCWLSATGLAIAGVAGAGSAGADGPAGPPTFNYSSAATAIGVQIAMQRNPDFSSLPDPFDVETPDSEAQLDSFGTSTADGHIGNLNGLGGVPGLICLAAGAATCAQIPVGQLTGGLIPSFPPPDPLDAHATYPAVQSATAPVIGTKAAQASFDSAGFSLGAAAAKATATQYATTTQVADQNLGIAGAISIGSATTSTSQVATADSLTTVATAKVSDIALGGTLLTIGSMKSTTTVVSAPGKPSTDTTSTVLADVKAAGLPATIDASGVHIDKNNLPANVVALVQKLVNQVLSTAGIKLSLGQVKSTNGDSGHTVSVAGLLITFDRTVKGTPPITIAPPAGVPCPPQLAALPLDPCSGVSLSLDGVYHGQIGLGQVGVVSMAQPGGIISTVPTPGSTSPSTSPTSDTGVGPLGGPPPPTAPTIISTNPATGPGPVIAPGQRAVADQLKDVSNRLKWFFPLLAMGLLALLARFRTPSRLPQA